MYGRPLGKRQRLLKRQKLAALHRVVAFSLLLAFLGPLEGSAVESVQNITAVPL